MYKRQPDDLDVVGRLVQTYRATTILLTPWTAMRLVDEDVAARHDLTSLSTLAFASAALPARVGRSLLAAVPGATITTAYAQGEAVPAVVLGVHDPDHPLRLGREAPGTTVKLVGLDRRPVADGALGEIVMHSAAPKRLYLDPERNRTTHVDGWTHTQDLGRREPDGTLTLFDRAVDVVHTAHGPVSSLAVEQVLYDHPGVREVAVVASGPEGAQDLSLIHI